MGVYRPPGESKRKGKGRVKARHETPDIGGEQAFKLRPGINKIRQKIRDLDLAIEANQKLEMKVVKERRDMRDARRKLVVRLGALGERYS